MLTDEKIANELKRRNAKALRDLVKKVTTAQNIDKQIRATKIKLENLIETRDKIYKELELVSDVNAPDITDSDDEFEGASEEPYASSVSHTLAVWETILRSENPTKQYAYYWGKNAPSMLFSAHEGRKKERRNHLFFSLRLKAIKNENKR